MSGERRLLLLRHAKAVAARPGQSDASDHGRPLSERGRLDATALGRTLRSRGLAPTLALVSTALRTRETFELLQPFGAATPRQVLRDALYLAEMAHLLDVVREEGGTADTVLLVGHNPGLHELALTLAGGDRALLQGFPTCRLALFTAVGEWSDLAPGRARLQDVLDP